MLNSLQFGRTFLSLPHLVGLILSLLPLSQTLKILYYSFLAPLQLFGCFSTLCECKLFLGLSIQRSLVNICIFNIDTTDVMVIIGAAGSSLIDFLQHGLIVVCFLVRLLVDIDARHGHPLDFCLHDHCSLSQ